MKKKKHAKRQKSNEEDLSPRRLLITCIEEMVVAAVRKDDTRIAPRTLRLLNRKIDGCVASEARNVLRGSIAKFTMEISVWRRY